MNVKAMHIEIEQSTQQVAANRGRSWLPEEIDWVLNKMQDRFIDQCLVPRQDGSGGFELDQSRADDIRMLVTSASLTPYIDSSERYKCFLPANYRNLLADWSYTKDLCGSVDSPATASHTQYITRLLQPLTTKVDSPYYETYSLTMPDITIQVPADLTSGHSYAGFPEKDDGILFLVPWVLWKSRTIYWERFGTLEYPRHFIVVRTSSYGGSVALVQDGNTFTDEVVSTNVLTYHTGSGVRVNNRLSPSNLIPSLLQSSFYKSHAHSPVTELEGINLNVYRDNSFTVLGVGVSYIRNPRPISLSLNSDCELSPQTHQKICDLATEYIKGTVQNAEGRELKNRDIAQRVTL